MNELQYNQKTTKEAVTMAQNKQNKAAQAMKKALEIFKKWGVRTMAKWSEALKLAWAIVKGLVKEVEKMVELKGTPKQVA